MSVLSKHNPQANAQNQNTKNSSQFFIQTTQPAQVNQTRENGSQTKPQPEAEARIMVIQLNQEEQIQLKEVKINKPTVYQDLHQQEKHILEIGIPKSWSILLGSIPQKHHIIHIKQLIKHKLVVMILTSFGSNLKLPGNFHHTKVCPAHYLGNQNQQLCILLTRYHNIALI